MELATKALVAAQEVCTTVVHRENRGFDFAGWALAMELFPSVMDAEEVLLTNDSIYGPIQPIGGILQTMRTRRCDFWGITESLEVERHLQSYFLLFKRDALAADTYRRFWAAVRALPTKHDVIEAYEVQLTRILSQAGLKPDAFIPFSGLESDICNPTLHLWRTLLLRAGLPFIKVQLLRDNPLNNDINEWSNLVENLGYDSRLIIEHLSRVAPSAKGLERVGI
jgi:lipopolysaccharide biosynthesis protein